LFYSTIAMVLFSQGSFVIGNEAVLEVYTS
jgi:hypothetical protein